MKKLIYISFIFIFLFSCDSGKSKIIGIWHISEFSINNKSQKEPISKYSISSNAIRIQFLENGFFILTSNSTKPKVQIGSTSIGGYTSEYTCKGKWSVGMFSKIEIQFINFHEQIGIQKGGYKLSDNRLIIDAKGDNDFSYFDLYR